MIAPRRSAPRVLMTADAVGGVWTYALDLAAGLGRTGVETTLVVLGPAPAAHQRSEAAAVPGLTLIETELPLDWTAFEAAEVLEVAAAVRGLARAHRADVIHLNTPALAALGGFSAPVVGACHSCLATWWSAVKEGPPPPDFRWRTQLLWRGLHACDVLVAPTRAFAQATAAAYEVPAPHRVWNGRAGPPSTRTAREAVVFTSGRLWDEGKNMAVLDRAAALMRRPLYAAGPLKGPNGAEVTLRSARALGPLTGAEVRAWLGRAAVFASAAVYEPFGLGVLEAAQAGCALVLADIPTFRELWEGAAVFVEPHDAAAFAAACDRLAEDPAEREALAGQARTRAGRYSVEAMCQAMLGVYRPFAPQLFPARSEEAAA